jgi:hypothetical protein
MKELPPPRRIVTGYTKEGKSTIVEDGPPHLTRTAQHRPGFKNSNLWTTSATPACVLEEDRSGSHEGIYPPKNGTVIRVIDIPPEGNDPAALERALGSMTNSVFPDRDRIKADKTKHPGMHITDTVDYAIILSGEMYAVLEEKETLMKAGDILIQRGTNHAWANRSTEICRVAFILIDGERRR